MNRLRSSLAPKPKPPDELSPEVRAALGDVAALRALCETKRPRLVQAQAAAELGFLLGRSRNPSDLDRALVHVQEAQSWPDLPRVVQARLAHAEGYVLYQQGREHSPVLALNRAVELFPPHHHLRARVFDTLGAYFHATIGDLVRARSYYERAYAEKERLVEKYGESEMWEGLAITSGSLGRLELTLERWAEAEKWTMVDLDLEQRHGASSRPTDDLEVTPAQRKESLRARAMLHGQLARIELGRAGTDRDAPARQRADRAVQHLETALKLVPAGTYTEVTLWFDSARAQIVLGDIVAAEQRLARADELAAKGKFAHFDPYIRHVRAQLLTEGLVDPLSSRLSVALSELDEAMAKFTGANQPQEECEVVFTKALVLHRVGQDEAARKIITGRGMSIAENKLFGQLQPLARLEALLGRIDPAALAEVKAARMRGGLPSEEHTGRLRGERKVITVWTCDIRGFAAYCMAHEDDEVVATLNRFFATLGEPIIAAGGVIDKYVGDNILAYFPTAASAAGVALGALHRVESLNTEWEHLFKQTLEIGIGLSTGQAVVGTVGFASKLEHTIIGKTVNLACRLVGVAKGGEIAIDEETRRALGPGFLTRPVGSSGRVDLKGFGKVPAWLLTGRAEGEPRGGKARKRGR